MLFAVTFGGVGFGVLFGMVMPEYYGAAIARDGELKSAIITGVYSNLEVNGEPFYSIHFVWFDDDGNENHGSTNAAYSQWEIRSSGYVIGEDFLVRVKNGRAVADDYRMSEGHGFMWIFVVAFGAVGVGMGTAFIVLLLRDFRNAAIAINGHNSTGKFISASVGMYVNNVPKYKMTFSFLDSAGVEHIVNTGTRWNQYEIEALENMGTFDVRYMGRHATVKKESITYTNKRTGVQSNEPVPVERPLDNYVNPTAKVSSNDRTDVRLYNQILNEIERTRTRNDMLDVLEKHSRTIDSETYFRLKDDIHRICEKRKLQ